jgi:hypothetical protein
MQIEKPDDQLESQLVIPPLVPMRLERPHFLKPKQTDIKYCNAYTATEGQTATHPMAGSTSRSIETIEMTVQRPMLLGATATRISYLWNIRW